MGEVMFMRELFIISAGLGTRMATTTPKALLHLTNEPCLTLTLKQVGHKFHKVYVVCNEMAVDEWSKYFAHLNDTYPELAKNVDAIWIKSGLGDGHAVMMALNATYPGKTNDITIMWGDVFVPQPQIIDELVSKQLSSSGYIPAIREENPYVSLLVDDNMKCISADFSKYGESHPSGFHDQSVFRFSRVALWASLTDLHAALWKNGRYITPGGELSLLHTFHHLYNVQDPLQVYSTEYPTLSFNNLAEMTQIQKEIALKWVRQFS